MACPLPAAAQGPWRSQYGRCTLVLFCLCLPLDYLHRSYTHTASWDMHPPALAQSPLPTVPPHRQALPNTAAIPGPCLGHHPSVPDPGCPRSRAHCQSQHSSAPAQVRQTGLKATTAKPPSTSAQLTPTSPSQGRLSQPSPAKPSSAQSHPLPAHPSLAHSSAHSSAPTAQLELSSLASVLICSASDGSLAAACCSPCSSPSLPSELDSISVTSRAAAP